MTGILWLTNIETAEPVGVPLSKLLLIEQKRAQDGGAVALYLDHGREVHVSESLSRVHELIGFLTHEPIRRSAPDPQHGSPGHIVATGEPRPMQGPKALAITA